MQKTLKFLFVLQLLFAGGLCAQMAMPDMLSQREMTARAEHVPDSVWNAASETSEGEAARSPAESTPNLIQRAPETVHLRLTQRTVDNAGQLDIYLPKPEMVSVQLFDAEGNFMRFLYSGQASGLGTVRVTFPWLDLPAGSYELRVAVGEELFTPRIVRI
ncbi:MAG: hypothetical protein AAGN35_01790 [Bacteroidota bacterium]